MHIRDIEDSVIATLAAFLEKKPATIKTRLLRKGGEMPVDSFDMLKIQLQLEETFGIDFPYDERTEEACRSVKSMALLIRELMRERDTELTKA